MAIPTFLIVLIIVLAIWELICKGRALWKASKNNQLGWFVAVLIINSAGILPLLYLKFFQEKHK